jgi:hypothetical protein
MSIIFDEAANREIPRPLVVGNFLGGLAVLAAGAFRFPTSACGELTVGRCEIYKKSYPWDMMIFPPHSKQSRLRNHCKRGAQMKYQV